MNDEYNALFGIVTSDYVIRVMNKEREELIRLTPNV